MERVVPILQPYKLVSPRASRRATTVINIGGVTIGGETRRRDRRPLLGREPRAASRAPRPVQGGRRHILRGGAYKPRTSPYAFQGLGEEGLELLRRGPRSGPACRSSPRSWTPPRRDCVERYADVHPDRRPQHAELRPAHARSAALGKPILLKRGMRRRSRSSLLGRRVHRLRAATRRHPLRARHPDLRDRDAQHARHLAVPASKAASSTCRSSSTRATPPASADLVRPLRRAAVAAGADGLMVEVHPPPEQALSDGPQSLTPTPSRVVADVKRCIDLMGKVLPESADTAVAVAEVRPSHGPGRRPPRRADGGSLVFALAASTGRGRGRISPRGAVDRARDGRDRRGVRGPRGARRRGRRGRGGGLGAGLVELVRRRWPPTQTTTAWSPISARPKSGLLDAPTPAERGRFIGGDPVCGG